MICNFALKSYSYVVSFFPPHSLSTNEWHDIQRRGITTCDRLLTRFSLCSLRTSVCFLWLSVIFNNNLATVMMLQQLGVPGESFQNAARELLEWCSDVRAFQPHFEQRLLGCLLVSLCTKHWYLCQSLSRTINTGELPQHVLYLLTPENYDYRVQRNANS